MLFLYIHLFCFVIGAWEIELFTCVECVCVCVCVCVYDRNALWPLNAECAHVFLLLEFSSKYRHTHFPHPYSGTASSKQTQWATGYHQPNHAIFNFNLSLLSLNYFFFFKLNRLHHSSSVFHSNEFNFQKFSEKNVRIVVNFKNSTWRWNCGNCTHQIGIQSNHPMRNSNERANFRWHDVDVFACFIFLLLCHFIVCVECRSSSSLLCSLAT